MGLNRDGHSVDPSTAIIHLLINHVTIFSFTRVLMSNKQGMREDANERSMQVGPGWIPPEHSSLLANGLPSTVEISPFS